MNNPIIPWNFSVYRPNCSGWEFKAASVLKLLHEQSLTRIAFSNNSMKLHGPFSKIRAGSTKRLLRYEAAPRYIQRIKDNLKSGDHPRKLWVLYILFAGGNTDLYVFRYKSTIDQIMKSVYVSQVMES
jgi:hypothetical protein